MQSFYEVRIKVGLEVNEAAEALGVTEEEINAYDTCVKSPDMPMSWVKNKLTQHWEQLIGQEKNLIHGSIPLYALRMLSFRFSDINKVARLFGYTAEEWREFELNQKALPWQKLRRFEKHFNRISFIETFGE